MPKATNASAENGSIQPSAPPVAVDDKHAILAQLLVRELRERIDAGEAYRDDEAASSSQDISLGEFGDYVLLEEIARGGMGVVYKARQISLNRIVALKTILAGRFATPREVQRFLTEVEAAAQLDHPGIVPVFAVGERGSGWFYSMAFVDGASLAQRIADGPLPPRRAAELVLQAAEAVAYAHAHGVIHRDLKPANILLDSAERPRVTDFGLAKQVAVDSGLTATGDIVGTPSYMPPEQAAGRTDEIGPASDIYALGATLYCLVTGRPPFQAASALETLQQVLNEEPVSPRRLNPAVDVDLETICLKCLQKEPSQRYASAADLASDLGCYLADQPIHARPISRPARLARWARRNPTLAWTASAFLVTLVAGTIVSTYFAFEAASNTKYYRNERIRADAETAKAHARLVEKEAALQKREAALQQTDVAIQNYVAAVTNAELLREPRFRPVLKILLNDALAHYKWYVLQHGEDRDPAVRASVAEAFSQIAQINRTSGSDQDAITALKQEIDVREKLIREQPGIARHYEALALGLFLSFGTSKPATRRQVGTSGWMMLNNR